MMIYARATFKHKKKKKTKGVIAKKLTAKELRQLQGTALPKYKTMDRSIPSLNSGLYNTSKKETLAYSGERKLLGIAAMHKSNLVPIFGEEEAKDVARMRRG